MLLLFRQRGNAFVFAYTVPFFAAVPRLGSIVDFSSLRRPAGAWTRQVLAGKHARHFARPFSAWSGLLVTRRGVRGHDVSNRTKSVKSAASALMMFFPAHYNKGGKAERRT
jgi:hypothetical protein